MTNTKGFTLIELMVSVGLFTIVMLLASGAYLMMINLNQQAQNISTGIDNLSFALETMTRTIRTGTGYNCAIFPMQGNCSCGGNNFYLTDATGIRVSYARSTSNAYCGPSGTGCIVQTVNGAPSALTDPSVNISSLTFYVSGVFTGDGQQPHVTIIVSGTVSSGAGKAPQTFTIETGATMRGSDL